MSLSPGLRLGVYEILGPLGAGGMGEVYRAKDAKLDREVAIKVLPESMAQDPEALARFEREVKAVAALSHPNILAIHDYGIQDAVAYAVMELLEGVTLRDRLRAGPLPSKQAVEYAIQIAKGLAAAHEKGIVHRDLKPENVFVARDGHVTILDFGLAKRSLPVEPEDPMSAPTKSKRTGPGTVLGTVGYMSPEQVRGLSVDHRSDIFAIGAILYEMLSGRRAFRGASPADTMSAILREQPPELSETKPDVPPALDHVVRHCLEKDPSDRFHAAKDVAFALTQASGSWATTDSTHAGLPLAGDRPSIAVLPFDNLSGDPEQDYFADGIVAEIITGLSRIKWLFVISRNSTFIYKGKPIDVRVVGRELGVRYVLEGSVRRSGNHVRVSGQLIETATASHVWADRYDGTLHDIFALQDEMTMNVIGAVEPTLRRAEIERARRKRPDNLAAYDLYLRALPLASTAMPEDADEALELLQAAIRLEPDYAAAHGFIAWCHEQRYLRGGLHAETRDTARRHAHLAIEAGVDDATALAMGGFVVGILERDYETALEALDRSLALSPSSALAFGFSSVLRAYMGAYATAIEHAKMGIRLSPYDPLIYLPYVGLALAHYFAGNFVEAAGAASRASAVNPRFSVPRYLHTAALVRLGRIDEAKATAKLLLELQPGFTVSGLVSGNITAPERMDLLASALRQVGLPE